MAEENDVIIPPPSKEESNIAIATSKDLPPSDFDFTDFTPIDFTPEFFEYVMGQFKKSRKQVQDGILLTPERLFALEAGDQFGAMYPGAGGYKELREGTSKLAPGKKLTDDEIIKALTTMEEKGFLEALGRRSVENLPSVAAFAAGAKASSEVIKRLPTYKRTGIRPIDMLGAVYEGGKSVAPIVGGVVTSVFSSPLGQELGDYVIGEETLPTPSTYSTMRAGEAAADVITFSPLLFKADSVLTDSLRDYLTNQLSKDFKNAGRDFDFSGTMKESLRKQYNNAVRKSGATSDKMYKRQGETFEGPPIVNDFFERGVAAVLEGKTAPGMLLRLHGLEQILKKSAKDARNNPFLFAFYETLAAAGAAGAMKIASEAAPMSGTETGAELTGSIAGPMAGGELTRLILSKIGRPVGAVIRGFRDEGFRGAGDELSRLGSEKKASAGFQQILKQLDDFGQVDTPEKLDELIEKLENFALIEQEIQTPDGTKVVRVNPTAGGASKNPVLMQIEETLKRQFEFLDNQQLNAAQAELDSATRLLNALYANANTRIGRDALIAAAEVEEALYNRKLSMRLSNAENKLLKSVNQLAKSKERNVSDIEVDIQGRPVVTAAGLQDLDEEDLISLTNRLQDLVVAQKQIARGQQNQLYNQVGQMDIAFFNEDGGFEQYPKFIRMLESEGILDKSDVADDLKNLLDYANLVKARMTPEGGLRDPVKVTLDAEGFTQNLEPTEETTSTIPLSVLTTRRKEALAIARDGTKNSETRRIAGMFAEAIQDDIQLMEDFGADEMNARQLQALRSANAFSRAFYDVYARSFVGDALQQTRQGVYRLALETIGNFNTTRPDLNAVRIADIKAAGQFALDNNLESAQAGVDSVHGVMDRIIRSARVEAYDPETKRINIDKLNEWMKKNARIEETFPSIFNDLRNVETAQSLLEGIGKVDTVTQREINKQTNFTSLLRDAKGQVRTDPTTAVQEAFSPGADQFARLNSLLKVIPKKGETVKKTIYTVTDNVSGLTSRFVSQKKAREYAKRMGPDFTQSQKTIEVNREMAIEGLKSSIFEYFIMGGAKSGATDVRPTKLLNADVIDYNLFGRKFATVTDKRRAARTGKREMSVAEYLQSRGIFSAEDVDNAKTGLKELAKAQSPEAISQLNVDLEKAKPLLDFALGVTGSAIGTKSQAMLTGGTGGPGSIIAAGKGAEALRNIALRIPESKRLMFTAELLQDPILLAKMLRTYKADPKNQMGMINSLKNYVENKGFVTLPMKTFTATRPSAQPDGDFDPRGPNQMPPSNVGASLTRPQPNLQSEVVPTTQAQQPLGPVTLGSNPPNQNVRTQYASLFPNDPISSMIQQPTRSFRRGGLASLLE